MNIDRRDQIIFGENYRKEAYEGGLRYFEELKRHELRILMEKRLFDTYPWRKYTEFVWFMEKYGNDDQLFLHGYVQSPDRKDFIRRQGGIIIEGIGRNRVWADDEKEARKVFSFLFRDADQFSLELPWAWYD